MKTEPNSLYLGVSGVLRYPVEVAGDPGEDRGRLPPAVPAAEWHEANEWPGAGQTPGGPMSGQ